MDAKLLMFVNPQIVMILGAVVVALIAIFSYAILKILFPDWPKTIGQPSLHSKESSSKTFDYNIDKFAD